MADDSPGIYSAEGSPICATDTWSLLNQVAVVIPCFNDGHVVSDAIRSALAEGATEVIVIDDGSTDAATIGTLATLSHSYVRVIRQPNGGLAAARTAGLKASSRPLLMVLDADDRIAPGALADMAQAMLDDSGLAVVWGDVERFGVHGRLVHRKGRSLDPWRITFMNELVASTMVRREAVLSVGGWTLADAFEDWDLWMALAQHGMKGRHIERITLLYRVDDPRMYRSALKRYGELVRTLETRHTALFRARVSNRAASQTGWLLKAAWTVIGAMPMPESLRRYALFGALVVCEPSMRRHR